MTKFQLRMQRIARAAVAVTTLAAVSALVVACGSSKPPQTAPPAGTTPSQSTTTGPTQTAPPRQATPPNHTRPTQPTRVGTPSCATSDLQVWLARDQSGGAAGTQYYLIEFKNVSDHACQLRGYPGVAAYGNGHQIGNPATWDAPINGSTVTLQPAATVHSLLGIRNADNYPAELCGKVTATALRIYPPNESTAVYVAFRFSACSATATRQLLGWPVQAGPGNPEPVHPMKRLIVPFGAGKWRANVMVTVPETWQLAKTQPQSCCQEPPTRCIVEAGSDYKGNIVNCRITVTYAPDPHSGISPNSPAPLSNQSCHRWSTPEESNATIAGRPGEYRRFVNRCTGAQFEQWTVMTSPQVAFFHQITAQSDRALAATIVGSAVLPPQTDPHRHLDVGYIRQISKRADGYHLRLDRVVPNMDGTIINYNPATYDYRLDGWVDGPRHLDRCDGWSDLNCNLAWLLRQFAKGPHPADGSFPVDGAYVYLRQQYEGYRVSFGGSPSPSWP